MSSKYTGKRRRTESENPFAVPTQAVVNDLSLKKRDELKYRDKEVNFNASTDVTTPPIDDRTIGASRCLWSSASVPAGVSSIKNPLFEGSVYICQNASVVGRGTDSNQCIGKKYNPEYFQWKATLSGGVNAIGINHIKVRQMLILDSHATRTPVNEADLFNYWDEGQGVSPMNGTGSHYMIDAMTNYSNKSRFRTLLDETQTIQVDPYYELPVGTTGQFLATIEGFKSFAKWENFEMEISEYTAGNPPTERICALGNNLILVLMFCIPRALTTNEANPPVYGFPTDGGNGGIAIVDGFTRFAFRG